MNVHSIAALTLERYFCLRDSKKISNDKLKTLIIVIFIICLWIIAFAFALPKSLSIIQRVDGDNSQLVSTWSQTKNKIYFSFILILFFVLPYAIIIIFSINILIFLREWVKKSNNLTSFRKSRKSSETSLKGSLARRLSMTLQRSTTRTLETRVNIIKKRTTFFVLAVAISYLITWSPLWAFQIYNEFATSETQYIMIINSIVFVFHYLNGIINPLLFMFLTQNFKDYYAKLKNDFRVMLKKSEFDRTIIIAPKRASNAATMTVM